jgi:hypothetical protein
MTRFVKGRSGNPAGRPRKLVAATTSAFDIILDRVFPLTQNGVTRDLSVDEALQLRTYQDALAGSRAARTAVLKMIAKREQWLAQRRSRGAPITMRSEIDPANAESALDILGISERPSALGEGLSDADARPRLATWAIKAALARRNRRKLSANHLRDAKLCAAKPNAIVWPDPES